MRLAQAGTDEIQAEQRRLGIQPCQILEQVAGGAAEIEDDVTRPIRARSSIERRVHTSMKWLRLLSSCRSSRSSDQFTAASSSA
jgi:hypothetical protein